MQHSPPHPQELELRAHCARVHYNPSSSSTSKGWWPHMRPEPTVLQVLGRRRRSLILSDGWRRTDAEDEKGKFLVRRDALLSVFTTERCAVLNPITNAAPVHLLDLQHSTLHYACPRRYNIAESPLLHLNIPLNHIVLRKHRSLLRLSRLLRRLETFSTNHWWTRNATSQLIA